MIATPIDWPAVVTASLRWQLHLARVKHDGLQSGVGDVFATATDDCSCRRRCKEESHRCLALTQSAAMNQTRKDGAVMNTCSEEDRSDQTSQDLMTKDS